MFIRSHPDGVALNVRVIPRSSGNGIAGIRGERLAVKVTAPPSEGRANKALVKFLGKLLGVPPSSITIVAGSSSREKTLLLKGVDEETVRSRVGSQASSQSE